MVQIPRRFFQKFVSRHSHIPRHHQHWATRCQQSTAMKFFSSTAAWSLTAATALHPVEAWLLSGPVRVSQPQQRHRYAFARTVASSATKLQAAVTSSSSDSTAVPETGRKTEENSSSSSNNDSSIQQQQQRQLGKVIAEGTMVSRFFGGLTAIQLNEDLGVQSNDSDDKPSSDSAVSTPMSVGLLSSPGAKATTTLSAADYQGKQVLFPNGSVGAVVAHRPPLVFCYSSTEDGSDDDDDKSLKDDDGFVKIVDSMATLQVSPEIRSVDCFGRPVDDDTTNSTDTTTKTLTSSSSISPPRAIFSPIPQISDIALINNPMLSGITMFDTLAPVGRGQNMLLIGDDVEEMRGYAMDFLRAQSEDGIASATKTTPAKGSTATKCIYASTESNRGAAVQRLRDAGLTDRVHFVGTRSATTAAAKHKKKEDAMSRAAEAISIASAACAVAESYAREDGKNALVVVDNIDLHKAFWDATTRVLVDVFGVDAVVQSDRDGAASSEMRAFYSTLIQRAGQFKQSRGGGSVTLVLLTTIPKEDTDDDTVFQPSDFTQGSDRMMERINLLAERKIPLTAATLRKINIPVPSVSEGKRRMVLQLVDDLISMSDGQIWLDEGLKTSGQQPPMDPQRSITRVGIGADTQSRADAPALRRIAEGLRLDLSQAANMEGAEATVASQKQVRRQRSLILAMHQPAGCGGRSLAESCVALLAAKEGFLDDAVDEGILGGTTEGLTLMSSLLEHVRTSVPAVTKGIDDSFDMSDADQAALNEAMSTFFKSK